MDWYSPFVLLLGRSYWGHPNAYHKSGPHLNIKTVCTGMRIPMLKIRRSWALSLAWGSYTGKTTSLICHTHTHTHPGSRYGIETILQGIGIPIINIRSRDHLIAVESISIMVSRYKDDVVSWPYNFHDSNPFIGKTAFLYWLPVSPLNVVTRAPCIYSPELRLTKCYYHLPFLCTHVSTLWFLNFLFYFFC